MLVDGYRLVGMVTRLSRIPVEYRTRGLALEGYARRARFDELVSGEARHGPTSASLRVRSPGPAGTA